MLKRLIQSQPADRETDRYAVRGKDSAACNCHDQSHKHTLTLTFKQLSCWHVNCRLHESSNVSMFCPCVCGCDIHCTMGTIPICRCTTYPASTRAMLTIKVKALCSWLNYLFTTIGRSVNSSKVDNQSQLTIYMSKLSL